MTFQYYPNERYLTDNEYKELIKHNRLKILGSIIIRIIASLPFLSILYLLSCTHEESKKLIIILLLAVLGLMLPAALAIILKYFVFKILEILSLVLESIFRFLIDLIKPNLKEKKKVKVELESFLTRMKENAIEILICLSFITIAGFLLWLINMTLTDPDHKTFSITMVSIIYSSGIAKYANSILEIAGFDLELLKKDKKNYSTSRFSQNINNEPKLPPGERKK